MMIKMTAILWRQIGLTLALTTGLVRADPTAADFQTYLLQHHYEAVKTGDENENEQTVETEINGKRVTFVIDSGAIRTVITTACARRLHLDVHDTGHAAHGAVGETQGHVGLAPISSFKIGSGEINHLSTIVVLPPRSELTVDGLFGFDSLQLNAAIIPVGGHGFLIKPGPGAAVPIDAFMQARRFTPVPLQVFDNELRVAATLDGHPMVAQIDTGAAYSEFNLSFVQELFKGQIHKIEGSYMRGVEGRNTTYYSFTPHELKLGAYTIPPMAVVALQGTALEKEKIDALIGFDILGMHRAVIDTGAGVLWMR